MRTINLQEIPKLSIPEQLSVIEEIWNNIVTHEADLPMPDSHKAELDRRYAEHLDSPDTLLSLEEMRQRIENWK